MPIDLYFIIALLVVVTIHEFSHALVASFFGDPTAKNAGRVSLNPLRHLDIVGTLMMIFAHIGWGKPVPVNPRYFRHPRRDEALTALAGLVSNLILAVVLALPSKYLAPYIPGQVNNFLGTLLDVSILLFIFNMLPFPPLDGSKFIGLIIPNRFRLAYNAYLQNGMIYFVGFLLFDQFVLGPYFHFSILQFLIGTIFTLVKTVIFLGT